MTNKAENLLILGSALIFVVAITHVVIAIVGGKLYLYFGAGEDFFHMDKIGSATPAVSTLFLALVFFLMGLYGLSGAGVLRLFPFMKYVLVAITGIFLLRGLVVVGEVAFIALLRYDHPLRFIFFSLFALTIGLCYLPATIQLFKPNNL